MDLNNGPGEARATQAKSANGQRVVPLPSFEGDVTSTRGQFGGLQAQQSTGQHQVSEVSPRDLRRRSSQIIVPCFAEFDIASNQPTTSGNVTSIPASSNDQTSEGQGIGGSIHPGAPAPNPAARMEVENSLKAAKVSPPVMSSAGNAPVTSSTGENMQRAHQNNSDNAKRRKIDMEPSTSSASPPSTMQSAQKSTKSSAQFPPSQSPAMARYIRKLFEEKEYLQAEVDKYERQGYTSRLAPGYTYASEGFYCVHEGITEDEDEVLKDLIDVNYDLRIRMTTVKMLRGEVIRQGLLGSGRGEDRECQILCWHLICTWP